MGCATTEVGLSVGGREMVGAAGMFVVVVLVLVLVLVLGVPTVAGGSSNSNGHEV